MWEVDCVYYKGPGQEQEDSEDGMAVVQAQKVGGLDQSISRGLVRGGNVPTPPGDGSGKSRWALRYPEIVAGGSACLPHHQAQQTAPTRVTWPLPRTLPIG